MKKTLFILITIAVFATMSGSALAAVVNMPSAGELISSWRINLLNLYEKNPSDWSIVEGGAWGKMIYSDKRFMFMGFGLDPKTNYTLIRYTDPWPGDPVCLASKNSSMIGSIHVSGPMMDGGPKVWLVKSEDINCDEANSWNGWNPTEYLFENNLI